MIRFLSHMVNAAFEVQTTTETVRDLSQNVIQVASISAMAHSKYEQMRFAKEQQDFLARQAAYQERMMRNQAVMQHLHLAGGLLQKYGEKR